MGFFDQRVEAAWCDYRDAADDYFTLPHNAPSWYRERLRRQRDEAMDKVREAEARRDQEQRRNDPDK